MNFKRLLEQNEILASVPCRIDLGGTLDLSTFFLPLNHLRPSTFNIALDMRTTVTLSPWRENRIKISSKGFKSAEFDAASAPFNHPMGLMFAVAGFFNAHGVHIHIASSSPPRSALGGSSAAAVAMTAAFFKALDHEIAGHKIAFIAHIIESSVAGVPCGLQDQLAAAYGGINQWFWSMGESGACATRNKLLAAEDDIELLNRSILVAYCGVPHVSSDINRRWVNQFLAGENREKWQRICRNTIDFSKAVKARDFDMAATFMNLETRLRLDMTPDVLNNIGQSLFNAAGKNECGARFTGAGGGGCIWAIGAAKKIQGLKESWKHIINREPQAQLLRTRIDTKGIRFSRN